MEIALLLLPLLINLALCFAGGYYLHRRNEKMQQELVMANTRRVVELDRQKLKMHLSMREAELQRLTLQVACQELANTYIDDSNELLCNGDWKLVREHLQKMAEGFRDEIDKEKKTDLSSSYTGMKMGGLAQWPLE